MAEYDKAADLTLSRQVFSDPKQFGTEVIIYDLETLGFKKRHDRRHDDSIGDILNSRYRTEEIWTNLSSFLAQIGSARQRIMQVLLNGN